MSKKKETKIIVAVSHLCPCKSWEVISSSEGYCKKCDREYDEKADTYIVYGHRYVDGIKSGRKVTRRVRGLKLALMAREIMKTPKGFDEVEKNPKCKFEYKEAEEVDPRDLQKFLKVLDRAKARQDLKEKNAPTETQVESIEKLKEEFDSTLKGIPGVTENIPKGIPIQRPKIPAHKVSAISESESKDLGEDFMAILESKTPDVYKHPSNLPDSCRCAATILMKYSQPLLMKIVERLKTYKLECLDEILISENEVVQRINRILHAPDFDEAILLRETAHQKQMRMVAEETNLLLRDHSVLLKSLLISVRNLER